MTSIQQPKGSRHVLFNAILIFSASIILFIGLTSELNIYDEALAIVGAERILIGELPYSEFWTIYAPGQFYLLAGFFSIFGSSILIERLLTIVIYIGMGWAWLALARKIHQGRSRFVALMVLAAWIAIIPLFGRAIPTALLFCYLSGFFLFRHFDTKGIKDILWAGFFLGVAALFRHDIAGFLFGAIFQAVFFFSLSDERVKENNISSKILFGLKRASMVIVGLTPMLIPLFFLLGLVGIEKLWQDLVIVPLDIFDDYRSLPFPDPIKALDTIVYPLFQFWRALLFYTPLTIFVITVLGIVYRVKKKITILNSPRFWIEITAFNFGINLLNTAMVRSDLEHTLPAWTGAILCILVILDWIKNNYTRGVITVLAFLFIGGYPFLQILDHVLELNNSEKIIVSGSPVFPASVDKKNAVEYFALLDAIKQNSDIGDHLYSGVADHTDFVLNDMMVYHLTFTHPATYYHELHPGITTTLLTQNKIFSQLDSTKPSLVVLTDFGGSKEANMSSKIKTPDIITPYIKSHYTLIRKFGNYTLYARNADVMNTTLP